MGMFICLFVVGFCFLYFETKQKGEYFLAGLNSDVFSFIPKSWEYNLLLTTLSQIRLKKRRKRESERENQNRWGREHRGHSLREDPCRVIHRIARKFQNLTNEDSCYKIHVSFKWIKQIGFKHKLQSIKQLVKLMDHSVFDRHYSHFVIFKSV